jgi:hypothetical protein
MPGAYIAVDVAYYLRAGWTRRIDPPGDGIGAFLELMGICIIAFWRIMLGMGFYIREQRKKGQAVKI